MSETGQNLGERSSRAELVAIVPALLAAIAEGAAIGVVYDLIQTARGEPLLLGPIGLTIAVVAGWCAARLLADRLGSAWPVTLVALTVIAGLVGWLQSEAVRAALSSGQVGRALTINQAGWLAGLAFLRGTAHARPPISERSLGRLLTFGVPALAIPLIIGRSLPEPARTAFQERATVEALVFVVSATLALALTRLARLGTVAGFDWRRNRTWLTLLGLVLLATVLAIPAAAVVGPSVQVALALLLPPLIVVSLVAGMSSITRRAVGIVLAVGGAVFIVTRLAQEMQPTPPTQPGGAAGGGPGSDDPVAVLVTWLPVIAVAVFVIVILARIWTRRRPPRLAPGIEELRDVLRDPPPVESRRPRRRLGWRGRGRAGAPANAIEAYVAILAEFAKSPELARLPSESPAHHAHRLRAADAGSLDLELLAADYQLARFGSATLTPAEDRRAIGRWRRLRDVLETAVATAEDIRKRQAAEAANVQRQLTAAEKQASSIDARR